MGSLDSKHKITMGVRKETISPGDGSTFPKTGQTVVVHYTGTLDNGKKFDSSRDRGSPFKFRIGNGEVYQGMGPRSCSDECWRTGYPDLLTRLCIWISWSSRIIPPNATLNFDVELLRVE